MISSHNCFFYQGRLSGGEEFFRGRIGETTDAEMVDSTDFQAPRKSAEYARTNNTYDKQH